MPRAVHGAVFTYSGVVSSVALLLSRIFRRASSDPERLRNKYRRAFSWSVSRGNAGKAHEDAGVVRLATSEYPDILEDYLSIRRKRKGNRLALSKLQLHMLEDIMVQEKSIKSYKEKLVTGTNLPDSRVVAAPRRFPSPGWIAGPSAPRCSGRDDKCFEREWLPERKSCPSSAVVSHISRKTSEMWGTRGLVKGIEKDRPLMGLRPVFFGPRTPWRTWGTRPRGKGFMVGLPSRDR